MFEIREAGAGVHRAWQGLAISSVLLSALACAPAQAQDPNLKHEQGQGVWSNRANAPMAAPSGPPMQWFDSHLALAWHDNSADGWVAAGYADQTSAEASALNACNRAMGQGCTLATGARNGAVAIARSNAGDLWSATGATQVQASAEAQRICEEKSEARCLVIRSADSPSWRGYAGGPRQEPVVFAPEGPPQRRYGAAAWTDAETARGDWNSTVWFSGGHANRQQAESSAIAACKQASGQGCEVVRTVSDTFLVASIMPDGSIRLSASADFDSAAQEARERCRKAGTTCEVKGIFNASRGESVSLHPPTARTVE